jgi:hypothetical protein
MIILSVKFKTDDCQKRFIDFNFEFDIQTTHQTKN